MEFERDPAKNTANVRKHEFDFADAEECFRSPLLVREDTRRDYGEQRRVALGCVQDEIVNVVFTHRGHYVRIISLRRASHRERQAYVQSLHHE